MIGLNEIRDYATALPGVTEGPPVRAAKRIASFKVAGKSFVGLEKGGLSLTISLDETTGRAIAAARTDAYEEIRGRGSRFMGLRVNLSKLSARRVCELIEQSWRFRAPSHVVAAHDKAGKRGSLKQPQPDAKPSRRPV